MGSGSRRVARIPLGPGVRRPVRAWGVSRRLLYPQVHAQYEHYHARRLGSGHGRGQGHTMAGRRGSWGGNIGTHVTRVLMVLGSAERLGPMTGSLACATWGASRA